MVETHVANIFINAGLVKDKFGLLVNWGFGLLVNWGFWVLRNTNPRCGNSRGNRNQLRMKIAKYSDPVNKPKVITKS